MYQRNRCTYYPVCSGTADFGSDVDSYVRVAHHAVADHVDDLVFEFDLTLRLFSGTLCF